MVGLWSFLRALTFALSNKSDLFFNIAVSVELTDVSPQVFDLLLVLNAGESHFGTRDLRHGIFYVVLERCFIPHDARASSVQSHVAAGPLSSPTRTVSGALDLTNAAIASGSLRFCLIRSRLPLGHGRFG